MPVLRLRLLLASLFKATTNESNHRAHRVHRGRTETFYQEYCGTFDPSPNPESHDNSMTAAGPFMGCLWRGRAAIRSRASLQAVPVGLGGPAACARVRAQEAGRARGEGARRSNEQHFRSDWSSINAPSAVTISRGILNDDRRT